MKKILDQYNDDRFMKSFFGGEHDLASIMDLYKGYQLHVVKNGKVYTWNNMKGAK